MPDLAGHIATANRNQEVIDHLLVEVDRYSAWVAAVAFYKALHVVEAVFSLDPKIIHCADHQSRERTLKTARKYERIYKHYSVLARASLIARYMQCDGTDYLVFSAYMSSNAVVSELLNKHLHGVEQHATQFLRPGHGLVSCKKHA